VAAAFLLFEHVHLHLNWCGLDEFGLHQHHCRVDVLLLNCRAGAGRPLSLAMPFLELLTNISTPLTGFAGCPLSRTIWTVCDLDLHLRFRAGGHGAATGDREDVFDGQSGKGLSILTLGLGDRGIPDP